MHEVTIAQNIIDIINETVPSVDLTRIDYVKVRAGILANVMTDSLLFCFNALKEKTPLAMTQMIIESSPVTVLCKQCGESTQVNDFIFSCPLCGTDNIEVTGGSELDIAEIKIKN